jgi:hypothetical protein
MKMNVYTPRNGTVIVDWSDLGISLFQFLFLLAVTLKRKLCHMCLLAKLHCAVSVYNSV